MVHQQLEPHQDLPDQVEQPMAHQQLEPHQDLSDQVQQPMVHQQLDPLEPHQEALEQHQRHPQRKLDTSVKRWNILPLLLPQTPLSYNP
jgi:hypothetical protein